MLEADEGLPAVRHLPAMWSKVGDQESVALVWDLYRRRLFPHCRSVIIDLARTYVAMSLPSR